MVRSWCERVLLNCTARYKLNIWDVGGQKTIRSYWRNYFEKTDALIWVVDATDRLRVGDCRDELKSLLLEEVQHLTRDSDPSDNVLSRDWPEQACWCF
jgi:GTPase SAR1 family protein